MRIESPAWECPNCKERTKIERQTIQHSHRTMVFNQPEAIQIQISVAKCKKCGTTYFDPLSNSQIEQAVDRVRLEKGRLVFG